MRLGEIMSTVFAGLWLAIVTAIKWLWKVVDSTINWLWCAKEMARMGIQEGLDVPSRFILEDMARVPVLRRVVTIGLSIKPIYCVVVALAIILLILGIGLWRKQMKRSGMLRLFASITMILLSVAEVAMWCCVLIRM